jgi:HAMP domain-containing protein
MLDERQAVCGGVILAQPVGIVESISRSVFYVTLITAGISVLLAILLSMQFSGFLVRPIERITQVARRMGEGSYAERIGDLPDNEIGELGDTLNMMASRLRQVIGKLSEEKNQLERIIGGIGEGVLHFNTTRVVKVDPTDAFGVSRAEMETRRQIHEIVCFLKKNSRAFEHATLISIAAEIGVRESRKLRGEYVLTAEDLLSLKMFDDAVVLANYNIDIHNPAGTGTDIHYFKDGEYYSIPYRSLLPKEYDNLLVAGRCISATHEAQAAVRVMPICACMGEAAGTAAALAKQTGKNVHTVDVQLLRNTLRSYGAELN